MSDKQVINESMEVHKQWYEDAKKITLDSLPEFIGHLLNDYQHDYGTICHALSAGAIATAWAMEKSPQGGITGFQAGAVMWGFVRHWNYEANKSGLRILDYDDLLYPQSLHRFDKTISPDIWDIIRKEATRKVEEYHHELTVEYPEKLKQYEEDLKQSTSLYLLLDQTDPIRAYKVVNQKNEGVYNGGIVYEIGKEVIDGNFNEDEYEQCGAGINLATLDWCLNVYQEDYKILIVEFNKLTKDGKNNILIPVASDGKFRVKECRVIGEKDLKEIGVKQ